MWIFTALIPVVLASSSGTADQSIIGIGSSGHKCEPMVVAEYTATRRDVRVSIAVLNSEELTFTVQLMESVDDADGAVAYSFMYALNDDCSVELHDPAAMHRIVDALHQLQFAEGILSDSSVEYLDSCKAIRVGSFVLSQQVLLTNGQSKMHELIDEHFIAHVQGLTLVVRVISDTKVYIGVALPLAANPNREATISVLANGQMRADGTLALYPAIEGDFQMYSTIRLLFNKIAGVQEIDDPAFTVSPDMHFISFNDLDLHRDMSSIAESDAAEEQSDTPIP
jgi:hypothetical protein